MICRPSGPSPTFGYNSGAKTITAFTKAGSLHPDFQVKFARLVPNSDTPFVLYCRSGRRTGILHDALGSSMGFTKAMHLSGGIVGWKKDGELYALAFDKNPSLYNKAH